MLFNLVKKLQYVVKRSSLMDDCQLCEVDLKVKQG